MCCMFVFKHIDRRFPSNCLFIQTVIPPICFLKLFVYTCQISCSNAAVPCVDSAQWRLPRRSMTGCFAVSCSAQCVFLIQHLWVVSWLVSPETWMRVRLDLSWRGTFPPLEDFSVSEVTLVDKVYCWVHGLREWLSVILSTVVFIWLVNATVFLLYVIRPIRYILHLLSSWCAPHHANRDAASEPDPGAILLGGGGHRLSLVSDHHPATGGVSLPHQMCLQVRLPSLHYAHSDKHRAWNLSGLFALYISSPHAVGNMIIEYMCSSYPKSKVTYLINRSFLYLLSFSVVTFI